MSESAEESDAKPAAKGGKLVTILAIVNFAAVLGLGGYIVYTQQHAAAQSKAAEPAKGGHGEKKGHGEKAEGEHGEKAEGEHGEKAEGGHGEEAEEGHGGKAEEGHRGGHGEEEEGESHGSGPLLPLDAMVTNLADPDSDRYLKATMQLRLTNEGARSEVESHLVPVRNQILLYLSSLTIEDLSGAENKRAIQKKVKRIANEAMPSSRIKQVYFTEFVIQ